MDIHLVTTNVRLEHWTGIIQDRINSGLTVKDYCIQNHVSRDAYFYWLRRIKLSAMESSPAQFAELKCQEPVTVSAVSTSPGFIPEMTLIQNGIILGINSATPKSLILKVMELLRHAE